MTRWEKVAVVGGVTLALLVGVPVLLALFGLWDHVLRLATWAFGGG